MSIQIKPPQTKTKTKAKSADVPAIQTLKDAQITLRKPGDLKPWDGNPRIHSDKQIVALMASIKKLGFQVPIITNEDGVVLAGHGRLEAAQRLGLEEVPSTSDGVLLTVTRFYQIPTHDGPPTHNTYITTVIKLPRVAAHIGFGMPHATSTIEKRKIGEDWS